MLACSKTYHIYQRDGQARGTVWLLVVIFAMGQIAGFDEITQLSMAQPCIHGAANTVHGS